MKILFSVSAPLAGVERFYTANRNSLRHIGPGVVEEDLRTAGLSSKRAMLSGLYHPTHVFADKLGHTSCQSR